MVKKLPIVAAGLLVVGLLLSPQSTGEFVKSSVSNGWHAVSEAVDALSSK
jgi:hypothetical protein